MAPIRLTIDVSNTRDGPQEQVEVLVSTSATFTQLPGSLLRRLGVSVRREVEALDAEGVITTEHVGEATIRLEGKSFITPVLFNEEDEEPVIGIVALATALLAVDEAGAALVPIFARR